MQLLQMLPRFGVVRSSFGKKASSNDLIGLRTDKNSTQKLRNVLGRTTQMLGLFSTCFRIDIDSDKLLGLVGLI